MPIRVVILLGINIIWSNSLYFILETLACYNMFRERDMAKYRQFYHVKYFGRDGDDGHEIISAHK